MLSGRPVSIPATVAIGCPIAAEVKAATPKDGNVTYHHDVLPILQNNCQECHRPGEVGPFSLMTYKQAVNWAADIKDYTQSRQMPPWKISEGMPFHNERRLSDRGHRRSGRLGRRRHARRRSEGCPAAREVRRGLAARQAGPGADACRTISRSARPATTCSAASCCRPNLTEDKYVAAVEVRPGNPRIVHHTLLFHRSRRRGPQARSSNAKDRTEDPHGGSELDNGPGYYGGMGRRLLRPAGSLGGWAPGQIAARLLPEGTGFLLPKGADVVMQIHYHRNGRVEKDRTAIGLYFAKKKVATAVPGRRRWPGCSWRSPPATSTFVVKGTILC